MKKLGKMLFEVLSSLFKKPATSEYPKKRRTIHDNVAGMISFEQPKCIGCNICVKNCPSNAIKITKLADKVFSCELSLAKCIFCSQCVLSCPKKALHTTDNFELAQIDKSKLTVKLEELASKTESVAPIKQQEIQTAKNEAIETAVAAPEKKETVSEASETAEKAETPAQAQPLEKSKAMQNNQESDKVKHKEEKLVKTSKENVVKKVQIQENNNRIK